MMFISGPIEGMDLIQTAPGSNVLLHSLTGRGNPATTSTSAVVTMHEHEFVDVRCVINVTNTSPVITITIANAARTHVSDVTDDFFNSSSTQARTFAGGLVDQHTTVTMLQPVGFRPLLVHHNKRMTCHATVPRHPPRAVSFLMNVTCKYHAEASPTRC